jgi:predicted secreted protein
MERARRIVLVAHCLLNANSRVEGVARYQGVHPLVAELTERGYGIIQLPCPEVASEGPDRPRKTRAEYDTPSYRALCRGVAEDAARQAAAYDDAGYDVVALIGVDGSPSCGVRTTSATPNGSTAVEAGETVRVSGRGVFMEELADALCDVSVTWTAIDSHDEDLGVGRVIADLEA